VPVLIGALVGFGYFKGFYDANIWASLHDVVRPEHRASAVGFMNSIGWLGGGTAPVVIAAPSGRYGMSACLSASSMLYLLFGLLLIYGIRGPLRRHFCSDKAAHLHLSSLKPTQAIKAGLADEYHLLVWPIVVGGGKSSLPAGAHIRLDLQTERRFASGMVHLHYRTKSG
jgi:MFS family permease